MRKPASRLSSGLPLGWPQAAGGEDGAGKATSVSLMVLLLLRQIATAHAGFAPARHFGVFECLQR
jgi:hypothetical protein